MNEEFTALFQAASTGDGQASVDLLDYSWNRTDDKTEKRKAAILVWKRNARRNGHPQISLQAARLFGRAGDFDSEIACLDCLAELDIAPAQHLRAAYLFKESKTERAMKLAKKSLDLNYDIGASLYFLMRSHHTFLIAKIYYWALSRWYYKRACFHRLQLKYTDFSKVWFKNSFDLSKWKSSDHSKILLAALPFEGVV